MEKLYLQFLETVEILFQVQLMQIMSTLPSWYDGICEILNKNLSNKFDITILTEYLTQHTTLITESKFQT